LRTGLRLRLFVQQLQQLLPQELLLVRPVQAEEELLPVELLPIELLR
jgi:hypothetical protein